MSLHTPIDDSAVMYPVSARSAERAPGAVLDTAWRRIAERGLAVRVGERGAGASRIRDVAAAIALRDGRGGPLADLEGAIRTAALRTRGVRIFVSGDFLHRANLLRLGAALLRVYLPAIVSRRGDLALSLCCLVRCVQSVLRVYHKL